MLNAVYTWSGSGVSGNGTTATVASAALALGSYTVMCGVYARLFPEHNKGVVDRLAGIAQSRTSHGIDKQPPIQPLNDNGLS
jgi:hypothetical protein